MTLKHPPPSWRALASLPPLLLSLLLLAAGTHGEKPSDQLPVPARTHTFKSYFADVVFEGLVPVFVATSIAVQGTYVPDEIVTLVGGTEELDCGPLKDKCTVKSVWQSRRRANAYTDIGTGPDLQPLNQYFELKAQNGKLRLLVNIQEFSLKYAALQGEDVPTGPGLEATTQPLLDFWADPDPNLGPYPVGMTTRGIETEDRQEYSATRQEAKQAAKDRWVEKKLGLRRQKRKTTTTTTTTTTSSSTSTSTEDEQLVGFMNVAATSFIFDFALIINTPGGLKRLDLTIIPKVYRKNVPREAFLCKPDGSAEPLQLASTLKDYIPRTDSCSAHTTRPAPYALVGTTFAALHPEEAAWLEERLDKTAPSVKGFVESKLVGKTLTNGEARLKIAIANSGGGKRSMLHSLGTAKALFDLGVFDQASYVSGASGGSWYTMAHFIASLAKSDRVVDPATVFADIKEEIYLSMWGDTFEMNDIFTDVTGPPFYPSRRGESTDETLCESELKLQSPLTFPFFSASPLDYWSRAITTQLMPSSRRAGRGLDLLFSSFATSPLIATGAGPLPVVAIMEVKGDNPAKLSDIRLWDVTPFDVSTNELNVQASFPTALLGSNALTLPDKCVVRLDNVGNVQGYSSYAAGGFSKALADMLCGSDLNDDTGCQQPGFVNPFKGFAGIPSSDELFSKDILRMADGAAVCAIPFWPFLTPQRPSDIIFAVDGGGNTNTTSFTISADTSPSPATCPSDVGTVCEKWTGTQCCNECSGTFADSDGYGCFSTNEVAKNNVFTSFEGYKNRVTANLMPPYPATEDPAAKFGQTVKIFGCHTVSTKTPVVSIPNRIILSGQSGHGTLKGSVNLRLPDEIRDGEQQYELDDILDLFDNAKSSLPNKPGLPDFGVCLACLYYAKATLDDNFMRTDSVCAPCYTNYCWVPSA